MSNARQEFHAFADMVCDVLESPNPERSAIELGESGALGRFDVVQEAQTEFVRVLARVAQARMTTDEQSRMANSIASDMGDIFAPLYPERSQG